MLSDFHIITITHNDLNVDEIGHFVIKSKNEEEVNDRLHALKKHFKLQELLYLSTCNRITYLTYDHHNWTSERVQQFFHEINPELDNTQISKLHKFVRVFSGEDAINHLFEVAASIDSLVVGEREIFRQFREAYDSSRAMGLTGDNLRLLEKYTVQAAKEVYAKTKIGEKPLSVVSLAIQKLLNSGLSPDAKIIMIGAGETNRLMAKFMVKHGYTNVVIFNRNLNNADEISKLLDAPAFHLSELQNYSKGFDAIIITTGATQALIDVNTYRKLIGKDASAKFIIDLSVPRNVDDDVINSFDLQYIDIEELRSLAQENLNLRKKEIAQAQKILKSKLKEFSKTYQQRKIEKAMQKVPGEVRAIKKRAIDQVFQKELAQLDEKSIHLINQMMDYMEKKCVSVPMKLAKAAIKN